MVLESKHDLFILWASHGTPDALSAVPEIRRWLLPACKRLDVVSVAPISRSFSRRMTHWTADQRGQDMQEAEEEATRSVDALGAEGVTTEVHLRWGTASREIVLQAEACHADVLVLGPDSAGPLQRAVGGGTWQQAVFDTTRSAFLARPQCDTSRDSVVLVFTSQRLFGRALEMLMALELPASVPVWLVALLEPVKPFGSMFVTLNEEIRSREQAAYDAQSEVLTKHLEDVATKLAEAGERSIRALVKEGESRDLTRHIEELQPGLVIVGDSPLTDPTSTERRSISQLASRLSCSVLIAR